MRTFYCKHFYEALAVQPCFPPLEKTLKKAFKMPFQGHYIYSLVSLQRDIGLL